MLVGLMTPQLMRSRQRWLSATERRIEATVRNISFMKGLKLMGMGEEAFKEIHQFRVVEIAIGKYVAHRPRPAFSLLTEIGGIGFLIRS